MCFQGQLGPEGAEIRRRLESDSLGKYFLRCTILTHLTSY